MIVRPGTLITSSPASGEDATPGAIVNVILKAGSTSGGILKAGGAGYIKKAG